MQHTYPWPFSALWQDENLRTRQVCGNHAVGFAIFSSSKVKAASAISRNREVAQKPTFANKLQSSPMRRPVGFTIFSSSKVKAASAITSHSEQGGRAKTDVRKQASVRSDASTSWLHNLF